MQQDLPRVFGHLPTSLGRALPTPCCRFHPSFVTASSHLHLPNVLLPPIHPLPGSIWGDTPVSDTVDVFRALPWQQGHPGLTRMMLWQVVRGSPTRLVPLTDMRRSPMLSSPERSAGPPCMRLATTTVGRMEPQPDSTMAMPRISPFCFRMQTCGGGHGEVVGTRRGVLGHGAHVTAPAQGSKQAARGPRSVGNTSAAQGATVRCHREVPAGTVLIPQHCLHPSKAALTSLQFSCREKWVSSALYCSWSSRARLYWRGLSSLGSMLLASRKRW